MEQKLKVSFDEPEHGWIGLKIMYGHVLYEDAVSYIFRSLTQLVDALDMLRDHDVQHCQKKVVWSLEPQELEMIFTKTKKTISLEVAVSRDHKRREGLKTTIVEIEGDYEHVCIPFWRALRSLQGRFSEEEFTARWHTPFPYQELDVLTKKIKSQQHNAYSSAKR